MHTDKNLQFITNCIHDTRVALMHCQTNSVLKLPNNLIVTDHVDDNGCIWFYTSRPRHFISEIDKEFSATLRYFKKGNSYALNIVGKGRIISDPEELLSLELPAEEVDRALNSQLLICVKILKVEYFDYKNDKKTNLFSRIKSFIYELMDYTEPNGASYDFNPASELQQYGF
ncbi:MAG: pyridoxamine 5'-phosphate oxidase family protein [Chitinophagaceae bacterium]|nr:pyridoxamine 5'-phosphate oxidase family protein [Chitinophagaceae bacterium]